MNGKSAILRDNLKYDLYPDKGHTLKKVIFFVCISVVFVLGLLFFKNNNNASFPNSTTKNRNITEIVSDGIASIKSRETNTINHDSSTNSAKKDAEENSYGSSALDKLLKDAEIYLLTSAADLIKNIH